MGFSLDQEARGQSGNLDLHASRAEEKGLGVWNFKGKKVNSQKDEKESVFGEQMFAGPYGSKEAQKGILTLRFCQLPPCLVHIILQLPVAIAPFLGAGPLSKLF